MTRPLPSPNLPPSLARRAALAAVLAVACHAARAAVYYVATDGSDANAGTSLAAPFRTLRCAASHLAAGDTCLIRGGVYRETLRPESSGTDGKPITFAAYRGETVVVSGADPVAGWTRSSGRVYSAPMAWNLGVGYNQVFLDGRMLWEARYPDPGPANSLLKPPLAEAVVTADTVSSPAFARPSGAWAGAYVVGGVGLSWSWQWARIAASSPSGVLSVLHGSSPRKIPKFGDVDWFTGAGRVFLVGGLAPGAPGEWGWKGGRLYLWAPAGDDPASHRIEAKRRAWAVDFDGEDRVVVRGLRLFAGAVRMDGDACALEDCRIAYLSHFTLFPWRGMDGQGGEARGYQGVFVPGDGNAIVGCTIDFTAGSAIVLRGRRNLVARCAIRDADYSGTYGEPILLAGSRNRVWFNTVRGAGRDVLYVGGAGDDIRYNDLSDAGRLCKDLGVVYSGFTDAKGAEPEGTRIAYNWIHGNSRGAVRPGPGIYLDNYSRYFRIDHNVIWDCQGDAGIRINAPAFGDLVYNNTLFRCDYIGTHTYDCWPDIDPDPAFWSRDIYAYDSRNNLYLDDMPQSQLVDWRRFDFRLAPGAPAIDAGSMIPGYTDGYCGAAPDLGAYESGRPRWTAGADGSAPGVPGAHGFPPRPTS